MISWMQKHKKWLVVTIWISTIAFVGAGFVGWGSYNFNSSNRSIAVVGDKEITIDELQDEYSNLFNQYNQMLGGQFTKEMAKQFGLENTALQLAIEKGLFMEYAKDLGLSITKDELLKYLFTIKSFQKNGKFDKATYVKVLQMSRLKPAEYEKKVRNELLMDKMRKIFTQKISKSEKQYLSKLTFIQDKLKIKIINKSDIDTKQASDKELKSYWETNKDKYKTDIKYNLALYEVDISQKSYSVDELQEYYKSNKNKFIDKDGKIKDFNTAKDEINRVLNLQNSKKQALKTYLKLKKNKIQFAKSMIISQLDLPFGNDNQKIIQSKKGDILKPILSNNKYQVLKIDDIIKPTTKTFEEAKDNVVIDFKREQKKKILDDTIAKNLKNFKGKTIGYVSITQPQKIKELKIEEATKFLQQLFTSLEKKGSIDLGEKVVLYEILDSKLGSYDASKDMLVSKNIEQLKNNEIFINLIKNLKLKYEIISYMKNN